MTIEPSGMPSSEPFLVQPAGFFARLMSGPIKIGPSPDRGIGYERVENAPFVLDITSPMTQWAFRVDAANDWRHPDAAEYIFASSPTFAGGSGPTAQATTSFQDFNFIGELGNSAASVRATVPVRSIDPEYGRQHVRHGRRSDRHKAPHAQRRTLEGHPIYDTSLSPPVRRPGYRAGVLLHRTRNACQFSLVRRDLYPCGDQVSRPHSDAPRDKQEPYSHGGGN